MESVTLKPFEELRVGLPTSLARIRISLEDGVSEIQGVEMAPTIEYTLQGPQSTSISTFTGATLSFSIEGQASQKVERTNFPTIAFNLHWALRGNGGDNARTMVIGHKDTGKTSLVRLLAAYQQRSGNGGYLVNLDPHLSHVSLPSQLSILTLKEALLSGTELLADSAATSHLNPLTAPSFPLIRSVGFHSPKSNRELYKAVFNQLATDLNKRLDLSGNAPVIIDTPPLTIADWDIIEEIISSFQVTTLVILDNQRLSDDLKRKMGDHHSSITMLNLPKPSSIVQKDPKFERSIQQFSIRSYFYGLPVLSHPKGTASTSSINSNLMSTSVTTASSNTLNPYTLHISTSDLIFLRPIEHLDLDQTESTNIHFEILSDPKEMELVNCILALVDDTNLNLNPGALITQIVEKSTVGLAYVQSVNDLTKKIKLLIPSPVRTLPTKVAIVTEMRYIE